jgi:hypothetical protein
VKRLRLVPFLVACLAIGVLIGGGSYVFAAHGGGQVICKIRGKNLVACPKGDLHGKRGARGPRGLPGPAGPQGISGGAGSGLNLNFNANLNSNEVKQVVIGNFTIREAAEASGSCNGIRLISAAEGRVSVGSAGPFSVIPANESVVLVGSSTSNMFTAVSANGASTVSGIVGQVTVGGHCLVSGYVTGL